MTRTVLRHSLAAAALSVTTLVFTGAAARAQAAPPAPARPARDSVVLLRPQSNTPPPSTVRPSAVPARMRAPTPAVVLPPSPGSPPPDSVRARAASASVAAPVPQALARPVPPAPGQSASRIRAQAVPVRTVNAREAPPTGATARCKDGTYQSGTPSSSQCAAHDGVAVFYPVARAPQRVRQ